MPINVGLHETFVKAPASENGGYMTPIFAGHDVGPSEIVDNCAFDAAGLLRYLL